MKQKKIKIIAITIFKNIECHKNFKHMVKTQKRSNFPLKLHQVHLGSISYSRYFCLFALKRFLTITLILFCFKKSYNSLRNLLFRLNNH